MINDDFFEILTPVGRLVAGSLFEARKTDFQGNPLVIKSGPNAGQPTQQFSFGVAISKTDPGLGELIAKITQAAQKGHPRLFANGTPDENQFSWKFTDGDSTRPNQNGIKPCERPGYPGNYVFYFTGQNAPRVYSKGGESKIVDPSAVKRGYFVRVLGNVKPNDSAANPGVYINYNLVEFFGYGEEIHTGPDAKAAFGSAPAVLPQGLTSAPVANSAPLGDTPKPPGGIQAAGGFPLPEARGGIEQSTGFMDVPAPPPDKPELLTYQGKDYTREQLQRAGWSDAAIDTLPRA
jgi:hypothetical protein